MPTGAHGAFVNATSAEQTPSPSTALSAGGSGSAAIPIEGSLITGQYYLIAQDAGNKLLAQTVRFYINTGDSDDL